MTLFIQLIAMNILLTNDILTYLSTYILIEYLKYSRVYQYHGWIIKIKSLSIRIHISGQASQASPTLAVYKDL